MRERFLLGRNPTGFHKIAYVEWGATSARPPVLCVHGLTRNGRDFDRISSVLGSETRVFCPDIVGRGKSDFLSDPALYNYAQYLADMTALTARIDTGSIDWIGTSMGGLIGMMLAADEGTPIRRLVLNDIGPFITLSALQRIASYVSLMPEFADLAGVERYMRQIYAPFGSLRAEDWQHLARFGTRELPNGHLTLAHDPLIAKSFFALTKDVDLWDIYDRIRCPVLLLHGTESDILSTAVAREMTQRGPKAELIEFPGIGHAPALMDGGQIAPIAAFLRR